ncbi:G-protein coupled receptor moody-like [Paramacrobiotus metropolitanus]|uniref:G-protein coupled receptor moody-like n=1 Tax=Paramacrobiotus metropolitanus TaxID=2943436 RepID=UPI002445F616|nr:G-protein coupled receptor moody-like [Paramacrobiotus metropolitanus]
MKNFSVTDRSINLTVLAIGMDALSYTVHFGVASVVLSVIGTVSSVVCIWHTKRQLQQYREKSAASQILLISLSLATFLFCGFCLPVNSYTMIQGPLNYLGDKLPLCLAHTYIYYLLITVCAFSHSSMAINRLLLVVINPCGFAAITTSLLISCWIFPAIIYLFPLLSIGGRFGYSPTRNRCGLVEIDTTYHLFCKVIYAFIPLMIVVVCYGWIIVNEVLVKRRVDRACSVVPRVRSAKRGRLQRDLKATKVACVMSIVFMVCYLPFAVYGIVVRRLEGLESVVGMGFDLWVWIGCSINPIVYGVLTQLLRRQKRLLTGVTHLEMEMSKTRSLGAGVMCVFPGANRVDDMAHRD